MNQNLKEIGQRIRCERNRKKWLINELSERTGLSIAHISSIERGRCNFSIECLVDITSALQIDVNYILFGKNEIIINTQEIQKIIDDCNQYEISILIRNAKYLKRILRKNNI